MSLEPIRQQASGEQIILLLYVLLLAMLITGCASVQETRGIPPTHLSGLYPGMQQSEVEKIIGNPISDIVLTDVGITAVYRFNRGYLPYENYKGSRAALYEVLNIMSIGSFYANRYSSQKALLHVEYDKNGGLIFAEENMEVNCNPYSPYAGKDCMATQENWLYPSTLPLPVTSLYQRAEKGDLEGQNELRLYKDIDTYCSNADLGNADAQKYIGDLYYHGTDRIKRNETRAYVWYSLAAKDGNSGATLELLKLESQMSSQDLEFAQQYREAWRPGQCERDLHGAIFKNK